MIRAYASAPGKILWMGGYSVLERPNPGYVTTVNAFVKVSVRPELDASVTLYAPQLGASATGSIDQSGLITADVPKELLLMKTCAEVAARYAAAEGKRIHGFSIQSHNDEAFSYKITKGRIAKSGLGSSAALTVAMVTSLLKAFEIDASKDEVHKLAQVSHSIATGKVGSGFDIAAACYGSIVYTRYSPEIIKSLPADFSNEELADLIKTEWDYSVEKLILPKGFRVSYANFVGESMITTASVGSVSEFKKKEPAMYKEIIKELNYANTEAIGALKKISKGDRGAMNAFKEAFEEGRTLSKELGRLSGVEIEPDDCTDLIGNSIKNGAFIAKLPGAGGKDAIAGISLSKKDEERLRNFWSSNNYLKILDVK